MQEDKSALAYAVEFGYADVARLLLENGATMDFEDEVSIIFLVKWYLK